MRKTVLVYANSHELDEAGSCTDRREFYPAYQSRIAAVSSGVGNLTEQALFSPWARKMSLHWLVKRSQLCHQLP